MGSTDKSFSNTGVEPKDYFLTETYVECNQESMTKERFPEQRFTEDADYDDAAIGEMLFNAYWEQVYHSQREGLSVGQSSRRRQCPIERCNPLLKQWQKAMIERSNLLSKQVKNKTLNMHRIRTLSGPKNFADCQAEIRKHEFQADYHRKSLPKLSETIESQQEELRRAPAEERHRRDQQLRHEQFSEQNWDLREAHEKSLTEMEELKKFQISTFDTIARKRVVEYQDTILELTGKIQDLQNELYEWFTRFSGCWINSQWKFPRYQPTCVFPTSSNSWRNAEPFSRNAVPQQWAAKYLGHAWYIGKRFCKSRCVFISTLSTRIASMEFIARRAAPFINSGEKWKARSRSRFEMPVWTVSQRFSHPQCRRLFKVIMGQTNNDCRFRIFTLTNSPRQQRSLVGR